jgi:hypothetical protein
MNLAQHQAIGVYLAAQFLRAFPEVFQVKTIIFVTDEYGLAIMPAVQNMVWTIGQNQSFLSCHGILHSRNLKPT